jgi:sugar lactone lactonase YvrE
LVLLGTDGIDRATIPKPAPGTWFWVGGPGGPSDAMPLQTISPDGSTLLFAIGDELDVNGTPETSTLYTVDLASHQTTAVADFPGRPPGATWSRDGQWIVLIDSRDIELISRTDPENRFTLPNIIPEEHWVLAAG